MIWSLESERGLWDAASSILPSCWLCIECVVAGIARLPSRTIWTVRDRCSGERMARKAPSRHDYGVADTIFHMWGGFYHHVHDNRAPFWPFSSGFGAGCDVQCALVHGGVVSPRSNDDRPRRGSSQRSASRISSAQAQKGVSFVVSSRFVVV